MDGEDLAAFAEIVDHPEDVLAHLVAALRPGADAQRQPPIFAAAGDLVLGAFDRIVMDEKLGHAVHHGDRRIVRMQRQPHVCLLGHRQHRLDEVFVVGPHVVGRVDPLEALLLHLFVKIVDAEFADAVLSGSSFEAISNYDFANDRDGRRIIEEKIKTGKYITYTPGDRAIFIDENDDGDAWRVKVVDGESRGREGWIHYRLGEMTEESRAQLARLE